MIFDILKTNENPREGLRRKEKTVDSRRVPFPYKGIEVSKHNCLSVLCHCAWQRLISCLDARNKEKKIKA